MITAEPEATHAPPAPDTPPTPDGLPKPRRERAILALIGGLFISVLDPGMTNVALPSIARALEIDSAAAVRLVLLHNLIILVVLLPVSALSERIGFRVLYAVGTTLCLVASLMAALSDSLATLTAARLVQGLGSGMVMCLFGGLVRNIYPASKLAAGIGLNATAVGLFSVLGPSLGAFILEWASWRWLYVVILPVCVATLWLTRALPDGPPRKPGVRFDWLGGALSVPVFGLLLLGLDAMGTIPLRSALFLLVAALLGAWLIRAARRHPAPVVPVDLLRAPVMAFAIAASAFAFASQMSAFVSLPFYFQKVLHYSYLETGVLLGMWSIGMAFMAQVAGRLANRYPVAWLCAIGAAMQGLGLAGVLLAPDGTGIALHMACMLLSGVGFGFFQTPNNRIILGSVPRSRSGAAGGLQATTRILSQGVGTAMVGVAFQLGGPHALATGVIISIVCATAAVAVNVLRTFHPAADPVFLR